MSNQHPITPPPELVFEWCRLLLGKTEVLVIAAQWGADQELEACCEWISNPDTMHLGPSDLRAARRPKPPSLKEQALEQLGCIQIDLNKFGMGISTDTIRRALEQLPD
jgi:hypothetical protein